MDGTHNIAKIKEYYYWASWVVQIKKTCISINEVREAKEKFWNVEYSNLKE